MDRRTAGDDGGAHLHQACRRRPHPHLPRGGSRRAPELVTRSRKRKGKNAGKPPPRPEALHYKVVELSTVDEGSLEHTVNVWVRQGWTLETVQFAMRESTKRPAMAFVFFTRVGEPAPAETAQTAGARAEGPAVDAWSRLAALAAEGEEP